MSSVPYNALQVGIASMENRLLQYGAKEYFFKAIICHFCTDADKAEVSANTSCLIGTYVHTTTL